MATTALLATDGSDFATDALRHAVTILGADCRYVVLSVVTPAAAPLAVGAIGPAPLGLPDPDSGIDVTLDGSHSDEAQTLVADTIAALGIEAESRVVVGDPAAEICAQAEELAVGVVVVGSRGRGWLARLVLGSVSSYVVNHAPCPVLVMRRPESPTEPGGEG